MADSDNHLLWDFKKRGHYEVFYITLNDLKTETGFWLRYTFNVPKKASDEGYAQIWCSFFDYKNPENNAALKKKFPLAELKQETGPFKLTIGENSLTSGSAVGHIDGAGNGAEWDIRWEPADKATRYLPPAVYALKFTDTTVLVPTIDAKISGTIKIGGRNFQLDGQPGCQVHLWGKKHANAWAWLHCNAFPNSPGTVVEGLAVRLKKGGVVLPPLTIIYLKHEGKEYNFYYFRHAALAQSKFGLGEWKFQTGNADWRIVGQTWCDRERLTLAEYSDPDDEPSYCANSETGGAHIKIQKRSGVVWKTIATLETDKTAHVEYSSREKPALARRVEPC